MTTKSILMIACITVLPATAIAGENGTESPFTFGFGARDLSLGASDVAECDFSTAAFWNASRLAGAQHLQAHVFTARLFESDVDYQYSSLVVPTLDFGTFALGIARLGVHGIEHRDANNYLLGSVSDDRLGAFLSYARRMRGYDVGLTISIEHHALSEYSATSSPGLTLSAGKRIGIESGFIEDARVALLARNVLSPSMNLASDQVDFPTAVGGGLALHMSPLTEGDADVAVYAFAEHVDRSGLAPAFGAEVNFGPGSLRGGVRDGQLSGGAGTHWGALGLDYAAVGRDYGLAHTFSLTVSLGRSLSQRREQRDARRHQEFDRLMSTRIEGRNTALVEQLVNNGVEAMGGGDYEAAADEFGRALFVAREAGLDTVQINERATRSRSLWEEEVRNGRYRSLVDSATARWNHRDMFGAQYYASMALTEQPGGDSALLLKSSADRALSAMASQEMMISDQLQIIDSLLIHGEDRRARMAAENLYEYAPANGAVSGMRDRARFEYYRSTATRAERFGLSSDARLYLDSAGSVFPSHSWCGTFAQTLDSRWPSTPDSDPRPVSAPTHRVSDVSIRQAQAPYRAGQDEFAAGNLAGAIENWEVADSIAPGIESVRDYLITAYRLMGVELYGKHNLPEALMYWRRAIELDPDNVDIKQYIERTQTELERLRALSYENR